MKKTNHVFLQLIRPYISYGIGGPFSTGKKKLALLFSLILTSSIYLIATELDGSCSFSIYAYYLQYTSSCIQYYYYSLRFGESSSSCQYSVSPCGFDKR